MKLYVSMKLNWTGFLNTSNKCKKQDKTFYKWAKEMLICKSLKQELNLMILDLKHVKLQGKYWSLRILKSRLEKIYHIKNIWLREESRANKNGKKKLKKKRKKRIPIVLSDLILVLRDLTTHISQTLINWMMQWMMKDKDQQPNVLRNSTKKEKNVRLKQTKTEMKLNSTKTKMNILSNPMLINVKI